MKTATYFGARRFGVVAMVALTVGFAATFGAATSSFAAAPGPASPSNVVASWDFDQVRGVITDQQADGDDLTLSGPWSSVAGKGTDPSAVRFAANPAAASTSVANGARFNPGTGSFALTGGVPRHKGCDLGVPQHRTARVVQRHRADQGAARARRQGRLPDQGRSGRVPLLPPDRERERQQVAHHHLCAQRHGRHRHPRRRGVQPRGHGGPRRHRRVRPAVPVRPRRSDLALRRTSSSATSVSRRTARRKARSSARPVDHHPPARRSDAGQVTRPLDGSALRRLVWFTPLSAGAHPSGKSRVGDTLPRPVRSRGHD